jgi:hypothetical protein
MNPRSQRLRNEPTATAARERIEMRPVPSSSRKSCGFNTSATTPCSHARLKGPHPESKKRVSLAGGEDDEDEDETAVSSDSISRACKRRPINIFRVDVAAALAWRELREVKADGDRMQVDIRRSDMLPKKMQ